MKLCRLISDHLKLEVLDMRLGQVLDYKDELQMIKSKKTFEEKKAKFFSTFGITSKTVHCEKAFWREQGDK